MNTMAEPTDSAMPAATTATTDPVTGTDATTGPADLNPRANEPHARNIASWDVARLRDLAHAYADATYLDNEVDLTLPTSSPIWRAVTTHRTRAAYRLAAAAAEIFSWKRNIP